MASYSNEKALTIAISLLKRKNPQNIETLKNLLFFIPNPNHVKDVLAAAVIELIHTCPHSAFWLFQHPELLEPEIKVREIVAEELTRKLLSWGYSPESFHFTSSYTLVISESKKCSLLSHQPSPTDRASFALIKTLLKQETDLFSSCPKRGAV